MNAKRVMGSCNVTPLRVVAGNDAVEVARVLLDAGADLSIRDDRWSADAMGWAKYLESQAMLALSSSMLEGTSYAWLYSMCPSQ